MPDGWSVLCRFLAEKPGVSRTLGNQLLRSGTSIGANVEEGQPAQSEADFVSKYSITCKEARETHYWLRLLTLSFPLQTSDFILQTYLRRSSFVSRSGGFEYPG